MELRNYKIFRLSELHIDNPDLRIDHHILENITDNIDTIIVTDECETDRIYPFPCIHQKELYDLYTNDKLSDKRIIFVTGDMTIRDLVEKLKNMINYKNNIEYCIYPYFFGISQYYNTERYILEVKSNEYTLYNKLTNSTHTITHPIKYNFISLVSTNRLYRYMLLSEFYKHNNYAWSNYPFSSESEIDSYENDKNFDEVDFYESYEWTGKYYSSKKKKSDILLGQSGVHNFVFKNDFSSFKNVKQLTEFDEWLDMSLDEEEYAEKFKDMEFLKSNIDFKFRPFQEIVPLEYLESCFDIVCESYVDYSVLYTEKTWKPIVFQKPFLGFGGRLYHTKLKELGFELYDEIFDYSFDLEPEFDIRFRMIIEQINRYVNMEPKHFQKIIDEKISDKILHNYNHYFNERLEFDNYLENHNYDYEAFIKKLVEDM